ncbi:hypothetical protein NPIL_99651, partial [Nephila pilipes]
TLLVVPDSSSVHKNNKVREPMIQHNEALANLSKSSNVFPQTLTVLEEGKNAKRKARGITDSDSQQSYILKTTAEEMNDASMYAYVALAFLRIETSECVKKYSCYVLNLEFLQLERKRQPLPGYSCWQPQLLLVLPHLLPVRSHMNKSIFGVIR